MMVDIGMFDHLVLLVGTNPLPNFVVASYLLKLKAAIPNEKASSVWCVCTTATRPIIERLNAALGVTCTPIVLSNPYDPAMVYHDIQKHLGSLEGTVHLNYTGGTKVMSVEGVLGALDKYKSRLVRSYLDPHAFVLRTSDGSFFPAQADLREHVQPNLEEILGLHDCDLQHAGNAPWTPLAEALRLLTGCLTDSGKEREYREWLRATLPDIDGYTVRARIDKAAKWAVTKTSAITWFAGEAFRPVLEQFKVTAPYAVAEAPTAWGHGNSSQRGTKAYRFVQFLRGGWLEECVWDYVKRAKCWNKADVNVFAVHRNAPPQSRQMELDVVALNGYSLTLFSCTSTGDEKTIKLKAFEAIHRARQLGGDEARAVVVCLARKNALKHLWDDLATDHGDRLPLRFISWEGLRDLPDSLEGIADGRTVAGEATEVTVF